MSAAGALRFDGSAGQLEGLLKQGSPEPAFAAVVCHPHPLHGGTMHNKVVYRVAASLAELGGAALRFQFRGVGLSAGSHDAGRGEVADVRSALDELDRRYPGLPLLVAGYSFGAWTALRAGAQDLRVCALIGIGLATTLHGFEALAHCARPKLFVQGEHDALGPLAEVRALAARLPPPTELAVIAGTDHLFAAHETEVGLAVSSFVGTVLRR